MRGPHHEGISGAAEIVLAAAAFQGAGAPLSSTPARRLTLATLVALCAALGALAFSAGSASAAELHLFETSFGPDGTAATAFEEPQGLGVDQSTGAIYVEDAAAHTVQKFNSAHEPEAFTGMAPNIVGGKLTGFSSQISQLAVSSTSHDLYVSNEGSGSIKAYQSDGEPADFTAGLSAGTNEIGGLGEVCGVAVDANGDIYASSPFDLHVYAADGEELTSFAAELGCAVAVDSHGTLYRDHLGEGIEKFTPSEFPVTSATSYASGGILDKTSQFLVEMTVDPTNEDLFVDEGTQVVQYREDGVREDVFGGEGADALALSSGVAVNGASGQIYVSDRGGKRQVEVFGPSVLDASTREASEVHGTSATLNGTVNAHGSQLSDCHFDYVPQSQFEASGFTAIAGSEEATCVPAAKEIPADSVEHAVSAKLSGLVAGTTYHFRLQATNAHGTISEEATFSTPPPPAITALSATTVTATSADLHAQISPRGLETTYYLEYGTSTEYGTRVPLHEAEDRDIGKGVEPVAVTQHLEGLFPNMTYHWRIVATNGAGTTTSLDHTFIYDEAGPGLPDNRSYEMVTPPQKNGAQIGVTASGSFVPDVSSDGSRLIMLSIQCFAGSGSCPVERGHLGSIYSFTRTPAGWVTAPLGPLATRFVTNGWAGFNADTDTALFHAPTPPLGGEDFYVRSPTGEFADIGQLSPEESQDIQYIRSLGPTILATPDFSRIAYTESAGPVGNAFEYLGSGDTTPVLVGVSGGPGSSDLISACETSYLNVSTSEPSHGALSADGHTLYFYARECPSGGTGANEHTAVPAGELYARIDSGETGARTVAISQPRAPQTLSSTPADEDCTSEECQKNITEEPNWRDGEGVGASEDGSKVLFTSSQQLTNDASEDPSASDDRGGPAACAQTTEANGCNLYLYDFDRPAGHNLIDLSAGDASGRGPRVQGVMATSTDGSHVYFVAKSVLTQTPNGLAQIAGEEQNNLYVYERDASAAGGHVAFIATLPASDQEDWTYGPGEPANVTPDGRFLVFPSSGALTPDATRGDGAQQIFRYDAGSSSHPPTLLRVSIGERGFGDNGNGGVGSALIVDAASVNLFRGGTPLSDPTMSDDGSRVFFQSPVALTPGALSDAQASRPVGFDAQNVYEWERAGTPGGSCPEGAPGGGCVFLISDGRDTSGTVALIGSDRSGSNVFFYTDDSLVPQDTDTEQDTYDARICTAASPCITAPPPSQPCQGEGCHGIPPASPSLLTPGSALFNGAGNQAPASTPRRPTKAVRCRRGKRLSHGKCVKRPKPKKRTRKSTHRKGSK